MWNSYQFNGLTCWTTGDRQQLIKANSVDDIINAVNDPANLYDYSGASLNKFYIGRQQGKEELPSGIYSLENINEERVLVETEFHKKDSFIDLSTIQLIEKDIDTFLKSKHIYDKLQIEYKRGLMLFGPPGTGKSFLINNLISNLKAENMLIIYMKVRMPLSMMKSLNKDPRVKILIFEEFTNLLQADWSCSEDTLNFLDGDKSINNTLVIGTTNYPEKLPDNITKRPGRFDRFYKIGYLKSDDIQRYLKHYNLKASEELLERDDLTIAMLKEIILIHLREGLSFVEAISRIENQVKIADEEFQEKEKVGFAGFTGG